MSGAEGIFAPGLTAHDMSRILRTAVGAAVGVAVVGLAVASLLGHPLLGAGVAVGLALGVANAFGVRSMAGRVAVAGGRKRVAVTSSLRRLGLVTAVVFGIVLLDRGMGLAAMAGLGVFQFVLLACSSRVLLRALRADPGTGT